MLIELSRKAKLILPSWFYFYFLFCSVCLLSGLSGSPVRGARLFIQHQQSERSVRSQHMQ
jgi:hypothetical protein